MSQVAPIYVVDSVTKLSGEHVGAVAIAGSHCGVYAAQVAALAGLAAVILNDAGVGLARAGIAGLDHLDAIDMPAAAIDYRSARIGDGRDMARRGILSHVNRAAERAGIEPGMSAQAAAELLSRSAAVRSKAVLPQPHEAREQIEIAGAVRQVWLIDSASLARAEDIGAVVITGSHGGLLGGHPEAAIKAPVFAAMFNDAGVGIDGTGISRLDALDARGIGALTVDANTARIGDGRSTFEDGRISHLNAAARAHGCEVGMTAADAAAVLSRIV